MLLKKLFNRYFHQFNMNVTESNKKLLVKYANRIVLNKGPTINMYGQKNKANINIL